MRRVALALATASLAAAALATPARAASGEYGIASFGMSPSLVQAGAHPDFTTAFSLNKDSEELPVAPTRSLSFELPPGFAGNPAAFPKCTERRLVESANLIGSVQEKGSCPIDSQVGVTNISVYTVQGVFDGTFTEPVYNMAPPPGVAAQLGFVAEVIPVVIDARLDPERHYALTANLDGAPSLKIVDSSTTTLWGVPADPSHDSLRITPYEAFRHEANPHPSYLLPTPFFTNPTSCAGPRVARMSAESYELFGQPPSTMETLVPGTTGCGLLEFEPRISLEPTTGQAETGTGLDVQLTLPQAGLEDTNLYAESHLKKAEVTLPEGVTVNPSEAADGLGVCSQADLARETATSAPNVGCPETSKIGSAIVKTPLLEEPLEGSLFLAKPYDNEFHSLLALYIVLKIPDRGLIVESAGKVELDPKTGQLVTTFDNLPQQPFSSFKLHFREGARAPLVTPPACGTYQTVAKLTPWSDPAHPVPAPSSFEVTSGPDHGPCPQGGTPPFEPGFSAGAINNNAASFSPYYLRLTRKDGNQDLTRFSTTLPPGALAKLAGVTQCPQAAIEAAKSKTGKEELASPSCPASSEIGRVLAGAGVGQVLTYVPGSLYLSGPYNGAPLSIAAIVPAVAGPFDVGTVVTQEALSLDPETGQARVDGSRSDPIPHILKGIPLKVRDVRVYVDRPEFTLNPTNCEPLSFGATLWGGGADVFSSADDVPVSLAQRFQSANCSLLGFKPSLSIKLKGGTRHGALPALTAIVRPHPGDANIARAQVALPHSEFLEQAHLDNICTRVQFAAGGGNGAGCPAASIYGRARAWSPLLDEPLEGPVFLRSNPSHHLPDLVAALHGIVDINLAGRIDSVGGGIRSTFEAVPDAPFSKFVLEMQGGRKGLLVNSENLCAGTFRATARFSAQNGRQVTLHPALRNSCAKGSKKRHHRGGGR